MVRVIFLLKNPFLHITTDSFASLILTGTDFGTEASRGA